MPEQLQQTKLKVGDEAPDFTLQDNKREAVRLGQFRNKKNVVLAFFPFAFSSVCSQQMPELEANKSKFDDLDAEILAISTDSRHSLNAWSKQMGTNFRYLSDFYPHGAVTEKYGVLNTAGFPERALFVIDKQGIIRYVDRQPTTMTIPEIQPALDVLRKLS